MQFWVDVFDILGKAGLLLGGAFGLYLAWLRVTAANRQAEASIKQAELGRREHVAELFNRAVGQLGDAKLEIRLGAIYTMRQISDDFPEITAMVFELLTAYIRENPKDYADAPPPADVREIMAMLRAKLET